MTAPRLDTLAGGPVRHRGLAAAIACLDPGELLPGQADLLGSARPLAGQSSVVCAPTGSGKSLIGDLAVVRAAALGGIGLWIAPSRALVAEHAARLQGAARMLGVPLRRWTSETGDPDPRAPGLVVATYEKAAQHLLETPSQEIPMAAVADEAHLLADPERGPLVECLLHQLRHVQLLALTACEPVARSIAEWLGIALVRGTLRPVSLREGIWSRESGILRWRDRVSGATAESRWRMPDDAARHSLLGLAARRFLARGVQTIVFASTRRDAWRVAAELLPFASQECLAVPIIEDPVVAPRLTALMERGLAVHTSELDSAARTIVEDQFRAGKVRLLVATPTLAEGVNLNADAVVQAPWHVGHAAPGERSPLASLTDCGFQNAGGRAGRPRGSGKPGLSVLAAPSDQVAEALYTRLLDPEAPREGLRPRGWSTDHALLMLPNGPVPISGGALQSLAEARWPLSSGSLPVLVERAEHLGGAVRDSDSGVTLSPLGCAARRHGVPLASMAEWRGVLAECADGSSGPWALATLVALAVPTAIVLGERRPTWGAGARRHLAARLRSEGPLGTWLAEALEGGRLAPMGSVQTVATLLEEGASSALAVRLEVPAGSWAELNRSVSRALAALSEIADIAEKPLLSLFIADAASALRTNPVNASNKASVAVIPIEPPASTTDRPALEIVRDSAGVVYYLGKAYTLRPLQFALLSLLAERPGEGMAYGRIMARLYTDGRAEQQQLQYHRKGIERALLGRVDGSLIELRPGVGMALRLDPGAVAFTGKATLAEDSGGPGALREIVA